eukprot:TRINITY_DN7081_c0_g2_i1.p1 TRINITY_DN7081_c0_g2~~TRINITY_DN7081_c0_g2_i1.p1  ORF type:complete len:454 (+),score=46.70 TRINITY_DN7081_c0_g2_i1:104-1363(+)
MASHATKIALPSLLMLLFCAAASLGSRVVEILADVSTLNSSSISSSSTSRHAVSPTKPRFEDYYVKKRGRPIGEGAYGVVFRARKKEGHRYNLAVKEVDVRNKKKAERRAKLEEDIMRMQLPFVADVERRFKHRGTVSLVMKYYKGGNVGDYIRTLMTPGMSYSLLKSWGAQMAYGLWVLHRAQILYSDVKTDNTFIVDDTLDQVVLGDFGLARTACMPDECAVGSVGTSYYASPAIAEGRRYGYEADWWAHAVTLFKMATGQCPIRSSNMNRSQLMERIAKAEGAHILKPIKGRYPALFEYLMRILDSKAYRNLENDGTRRLMVGKASEHPILSDKFWHGFDDPEKYAEQIDKYWHKLCEGFSINTDKCVSIQVDQPQPHILVESDESESESESELNEPEKELVDAVGCAGCLNFFAA